MHSDMITAMPRATAISQDEQARMVELYAAGLSCHEVGREVGRAATTVRNALIRAGVATRLKYAPDGQVTAEERQQIVEMYATGMSCRTVGDAVGRGSRTVWRILLEEGVQPRKPRRAQEAPVGERFQRWTVLGPDTAKGQRQGMALYWLCRCDCGAEHNVRAESLRNGSSRACSPCARSRHETPGPLGSWYWSSVLTKAASRGLAVEVGPAYLVELFDQQGGRCALTGVALTLTRGFTRKKGAQTASLDRIDSALGYLPGNVQWVHKDVNRMKNVYGEDYFVEVCRAVAAWRSA